MTTVIRRPPPPVHKRMDFQPSTRGSLKGIYQTPAKIEKLLPESPRPMEMLQGVKVFNGNALTAFDSALHEHLVSWAFENDHRQTARSYTIPFSTIRRFMGPYVKVEDIKESVARLTAVQLSYCAPGGRHFEAVPMLTAWRELTIKDDPQLGFQFPEPISQLMRDMSHAGYAHIELVPITSGMKSKYSQPLYKHLAYEASRHKWIPGEDNAVTLFLTPDQVVEITGFKTDDQGHYNVGRVTGFITETFPGDLQDVLKFSVSVATRYAAVKGRKVEGYDIKLKIHAPAMHLIRLKYERHNLIRHTHDDKKYVVQSDLWLRASRIFSKEGTEYVSLFHHHYFDLWKIALKEALDGKALTAGYTRDYRGDGLLAAIEEHGATHAAWAFLCEEIERPDLLTHLNLVIFRERDNLKFEAELARRERIGLKTSKVRARKARQTKVLSEQEWLDKYTTEKAAREAQKAEQYDPATATIFDAIPDFDTPVVPAAAPDEEVTDWTNCRTFAVRFRDTIDEEDAYALFDAFKRERGWKGDRPFLVDAVFPVEDLNGFTIKISPNEQEFEALMSDIEWAVETKGFLK